MIDDKNQYSSFISRVSPSLGPIRPRISIRQGSARRNNLASPCSCAEARKRNALFEFKQVELQLFGGIAVFYAGASVRADAAASAFVDTAAPLHGFNLCNQ
jgi:hypothetical protein